MSSCLCARKFLRRKAQRHKEDLNAFGEFGVNEMMAFGSNHVRRTGAIIAALICLSTVPLSAQKPTSTRLKRVAVYDDSGRVYADATVGNLTVSGVERVYRKYILGKSALSAEAAARTAYCDMGGTKELLQLSVKEGMKKFSKADKALLRTGDVTVKRRLATASIAFLDNVPSEAIQKDEMLGPGAYHDALAGMESALNVCKFFGQLR